MWNEAIVDMRVVGEAVKQHKTRPAAWEISDIEVSTSVLNPVLGEIGKGCALRVRHDRFPLVVSG
jgi:hypothetical protein